MKSLTFELIYSKKHMILQKENLCFVFSCVEKPTVISDIKLTVLVNIKILFELFNI